MLSTSGMSCPSLFLSSSLSLPISWCSSAASRKPHVGIVELRSQATDGPCGLDDRLPPGGERPARDRGVPVRRSLGLHDEGAEQPVVDGSTETGAGVQVVTALLAGVVGHAEAVGAAGSQGHGRRGVLAEGVPRRRQGELEAVDVEAERPGGRPVGVAHLDAVALVGADHQGLYGVAVQSDRHLLGEGLRLHRGDVAREGVDLALRVVVTEPVERGVDVHGGDVEDLVGGAAREAAHGLWRGSGGCRHRGGRCGGGGHRDDGQQRDGATAHGPYVAGRPERVRAAAGAPARGRRTGGRPRATTRCPWPGPRSEGPPYLRRRRWSGCRCPRLRPGPRPSRAGGP